MAKGMYASIGSTTKKIKRNYAVVGGVTRKVKKMYAVVNGVTRLIFSGSAEIVYKGADLSLVYSRYLPAATNVGDYALFAGGGTRNSSTDATDTVIPFNSSLTRGNADSLWKGKTRFSGTSLGTYAIFGCGYGNSGTNYIYDIYDTALTHTHQSNGGTPQYNSSATTIDSYALFAGGNSSARVDSFDVSLTRTQLDSLSANKINLASATVGNYAVFAGGRNPNNQNTYNAIEAYNTSLTKITASATLAKNGPATGVSVGGYMLIHTHSSYSDAIEILNSSLTKTTGTSLSEGRSYEKAVSLNGYALFGGGTLNSGMSTVVDAYDESLTRSVVTNFTYARESYAATTVGDYALFGGGAESGTSSTIHSSIEVYQVK